MSLSICRNVTSVQEVLQKVTWCSTSISTMFGTSICRVLRICVKVPHYRALSAGCAGSVAAAEGRLTRRFCCTDASRVRGCTVDPELEEQFVFVDCTGETHD